MKRLFSIFFFFLCAMTLIAQSASFGVKAGYGVTLGQDKNITEAFSVRSELQNGFHLGLYARIGQRVYVQPEVTYNFYAFNQGFRVNDEPVPPCKYYAHTIDIPLLVGYSIVNTKLFKFRVMAGPKISCNVGKLKDHDLGGIKEEIRKARLGLDCGIGIDAWRMSFDVRYNLTQMLYKYVDGEGYALKTPINNIFVVSIGYRIIGDNLKK